MTNEGMDLRSWHHSLNIMLRKCICPLLWHTGHLSGSRVPIAYQTTDPMASGRHSIKDRMGSNVWSPNSHFLCMHDKRCDCGIRDHILMTTYWWCRGRALDHNFRLVKVSSDIVTQISNTFNHTVSVLEIYPTWLYQMTNPTSSCKIIRTQYSTN